MIEERTLNLQDIMPLESVKLLTIDNFDVIDDGVNDPIFVIDGKNYQSDLLTFYDGQVSITREVLSAVFSQYDGSPDAKFQPVYDKIANLYTGVTEYGEDILKDWDGEFEEDINEYAKRIGVAFFIRNNDGSYISVDKVEYNYADQGFMADVGDIEFYIVFINQNI